MIKISYLLQKLYKTPKTILQNIKTQLQNSQNTQKQDKNKCNFKIKHRLIFFTVKFLIPIFTA